MSCKGKQRWPELVGNDGKTAALKIESENSSVHIFILQEGSPVTSDFRCDRVRVFINTRGIVVKTPVVG
ncbi:hypothetical protein SOVF_043920 [Spinacia oleracea]|nr:hypothetical protein SOVF_043920 [Spinacia oleracea]